MPDPAFIKELPFSIQIIINVAIFLVTIIIGLRSYYAGKKDDKAKETSIIMTSSNVKFIEEMQEIFENYSSDFSRIADALEEISGHLAEQVKNAEIDREVRRIIGERKRGGRKPSENSVDNSEESQ